ncbi:2Fe-2S iron-sulfur cluster-binding protein [Paralysiella testudinis]|uniref:2Fe-2S iron-sulfur cluster binding domain-containing protein n=1 Tax=Paralysiella testudinis TaxID=2809020 RepID=A0A892ZIG4_9NEIS|nr:2Fe-2S iron-sulfur cluster-binding protein [Paralysiella testudinis]QRQ82722.1 2Fe-2S iron-sulfur cluster binding domain-containing protein [Paralysiella testudinis]
MGFHVCIKEHGNAATCLRNIEVAEGQSLLAACERSCQTAIHVGCRGGGCGVCRIQILSGRYRHKAMSKTHINAQDLAAGMVLACRVFPESDMEIVPQQTAVTRNPFMENGHNNS